MTYDDGRHEARTPPNTFLACLMRELHSAATGPVREDNFDPLMDDAPVPAITDFKTGILNISRDLDELEAIYCSWQDDFSRALMVRLLTMRLLGAARIEMPFTGVEIRQLQEGAGRLAVPGPALDLGLGWTSERFDLSRLGYPILADLHRVNVMTIFMLEQYACPQHAEARVRAGDVVIDGGGCWGDATLYFAHKVGPEGRVISFEFTPGNLELMASNLNLNTELASQVRVEQAALWHTSEERLTFEPRGPGTSVLREEGSKSVLTRAIDDLGVDRVDFIKLDIEGAELAALQGAEDTIRRHRPRLAVSLYHKPEDWIEIPRFLRGLDPAYKFSLGHFTLNYWETVLFAW